MIRSLKNSLFIILMILAGCKSKTKPDELSLPFINKPDFTPEWIEKNDPAYAAIHQIPAFSFTNQNGEAITEKTVEGKIYVADFIFTKCGSICPKMTAQTGRIRCWGRSPRRPLAWPTPPRA